MQIDLTQKPKQNNVDVGVDYTKRIIASLKAKAKEHNTSGGDRVTFSQLKAVFLEGAESRSNDKTLPLCGFARVNMFIRLFKSSSTISELGTLSAKGAKSFNFGDHLTPKDEDFLKANEDIDRYRLDFDVKNIEELYFDTYGHILPYEEYL